MRDINNNNLIEITDGDRVLYSNQIPLKLIINSKPNLKKSCHSPEAALWQAVIIQAFEDASSKSKKKRKKSHKIQAKNWLEGRGLAHRELKNVCQFAGVRLEKLKHLIENLR